MPRSTTKMIFSIVIFVLISVTASQEKVKTNSPTTQISTTDPGDTSESRTTTQQIIIQQTSKDVINDNPTTTSQSTWLPPKSVQTTFESAITTIDSNETTFPEKTNSTVTELSNSPTTQTPTKMTDPGDSFESLTTTQIINQQTTTTDVTRNTQTATSQSTWLPQTSVLTTSESVITTVDSIETTLPEKPNGTVTVQGDREQDVAANPGLIAVLCIFGIVMAIIVVVVIVKAVRSRSPKFERLDDVPMGKINENAPFAHYPPK